MRFFREIRTSEKITDKDAVKKQQSENYKQIKPKSNMTYEEAKEFVNNLFK